MIHHLLQPVFRYLLRLVVVGGGGGDVEPLLPAPHSSTPSPPAMLTTHSDHRVRSPARFKL